MDEEFVTLARIVRSRGNRGEVLATDLTDREDCFSPSSRLFLESFARRAVAKRRWKRLGDSVIAGY